MEEVRYIYGVIGMSEEKSFGPIGIGEKDNEVYTIPYQDIAAVISNLQIIDYKSLTKDVLARYLIAHQSIIEQVMKHHTIIPFKFGTTAESNEEIRAIMAHSYPKLTEVLKKMQDKIELDVMALWDKSKIFKDIAEEPEVKKFKEAIKQNPSNQDRVKLGRMVAISLYKRREKCAKEILGKLGKFSEDLSIHDVMRDNMIINISLLIRKDREKALDFEIDELDKKYEGRVNFRCVGPLPPYSFNVIEVKKIGFDTLENARSTLKLPGEVTLNDIKRSYRRLALKYHPDKNSLPDAQSKFQAVKEAYGVLVECCRGDKLYFKKENFKDFFLIRMLRVEEGNYKPQDI